MKNTSKDSRNGSTSTSSNDSKKGDWKKTNTASGKVHGTKESKSLNGEEKSKDDKRK
jgi:hypothetical protein